MSDKIVRLLEEILQHVKAGGSTCCQTPAQTGNRTPAVFDYDGDDSIQNVVDCLRRAIRLNKKGVLLSKKERNVAREAIKELKDDYDVLNTNGHDYWTINGL